MDNVFMRSKNSKTSDPQILLLNLISQINILNILIYKI